MNKVNIEKKSEYKFHNVKNQVLAVFAANTIMFSHGVIIGWLSPALSILQSEDTPLESGPVTIAEISWLGSIICLGALIGSLSCGYIAALFGCKLALLILAMPALTFWLIIIFGYHVHHLYFARFIAGWCGGAVLTCMPLFIGDIANNDIRGRLGTIQQITRNFGVLLAYTVGAYIEYSIQPYIFICIPILFFILFGYLPSSPQYLLRIGKVEEAKEALKFYKGCKGETLEEEKALHCEFERLKLVASETKERPAFSFRYLIEPECCKKLAISLMLCLLNQLCGSFTVVTYSNYIFQQTGTTFSSSMSSIVLAILMICGTFLTTRFVDSVGRKKLLLTSLFGCAVGNASMGTYLYLESIGVDVQAFNWVPMLSLGTVVLVSAIGLLVLPGICIIEWLPSKIRAFGLILCTSAVNIFAFSTTKIFPILAEHIHLYGCMFIFAISCSFGVVFFAIVMEETKGKSLDTINHDEKVAKKKSSSTNLQHAKY